MSFFRTNVRSELRSVAAGELSPWLNFVCNAKRTTEELNRLNQTVPTIFVFDVARGKVRTWPKPDSEVSRFFSRRVELYRDFIEGILGHRLGLATTFGFCIGDFAVENDLVPLLAFQKRHGGRSILFPDPDFLYCDFYADPKFIDNLAFEAKSNTAVFAGSTTGAFITLEKIQLGEVPRINAAQFFRGHADVRFFFPTSLDLVRTTRFERRSWHWTLGGPVETSLTLNSLAAASCSQWTEMGVLLASSSGPTSDCVLAKYDFPHVLYYFGLLKPGTHFVPISSNEDVSGF